MVRKLSFLFDENISYEVVRQLRVKNPDIVAESVHTWKDGVYKNTFDEEIIKAAHIAGLTLVTYDKQILKEMNKFFQSGESFSGIIFIDDKTIPSRNIGDTVKVMLTYWEKNKNINFKNQLRYLNR